MIVFHLRAHDDVPADAWVDPDPRVVPPIPEGYQWNRWTPPEWMVAEMSSLFKRLGRSLVSLRASVSELNQSVKQLEEHRENNLRSRD